MKRVLHFPLDRGADRLRQAGRRKHRLIELDLETGIAALRHRRDARGERRALRARDRERLEAAILHVRQHAGSREKTRLDLPADEIHHDLGIALVGDVDARETRLHAEIFHGQMTRVAAPTAAAIEHGSILARLGIGNELGQRIGRHRWMHDKGK